jgi:signal transduction histidine kinase
MRPAVAGDAATPQEVISKVKEAAAYLQKNGKAGLKAFDSADSPFVFKDTYVFVYDCAAGLADVAHPAAKTKVSKVATNADATGRVTGPEMCKLAERPNGGWIEYMWWKPVKVEGEKQLAYAKEPSRKVTYMLGVKGQPYQVGAGVYNDTATVKQLDAMLTK